MSELLAVNSLRIGVEPVDVELDDDSGILWTSLQTAFPGCSGMYYRDEGNDCKKSVRFDGKKFLAPGGSWNNRQFYVTLSQKCHAAQGNIAGSNYSEATKMFERNVQAVQRMLAATGMKIDMSHLSKRKTSREHRDSDERPPSGISTPVPDPIHAIKERSELLQSSQRDLTPLEQQFLDLARISTAKDQIIESHRQEIAKLNERIREFDKEAKHRNAQLETANAKIAAQEAELEILRNLGGQFNESKETAAELRNNVEQMTDELKTLRAKIEQLHKENEELRENNEASYNRNRELAENLEVMKTSKEILSKELNQLRPFAEAAELMQDLENVPNYIETLERNKQLLEENETCKNEIESSKKAFIELQNVHYPMAEEMEKLRQRNEDLEQHLSHVDEEIKCLNENWAKELRDKQNEWDQIKTDAEAELFSLRDQIAHLQNIVECASREAAEQARRADELEHNIQEIRQKTTAAHIKKQDELTRKVRTLTEQLEEAESRVAELNVLVTSLAQDAHSSRRDIADLL
ncbi:unnamed protein product [Caenorhabditis bovis]|uniref:TAR DNA-binding protein 43 N-terminal domain-containing protein n=1 Tax=Caenorhabditis bovis TaxID=2654633 RepID=A0A8S1EW19_9PELO|nr:unnamed protein product [Caenorhabditis bovis]